MKDLTGIPEHIDESVFGTPDFSLSRSKGGRVNRYCRVYVVQDEEALAAEKALNASKVGFLELPNFFEVEGFTTLEEVETWWTEKEDLLK